MDLVNLDLAFRAAIAKKADEGKVSDEDARYQYTELLSRITSEVRNREHAERMETAAFLQSLSSGPVVCNRIGTTVICN
jgi:hypothetical protein